MNTDCFLEFDMDDKQCRSGRVSYLFGKLPPSSETVLGRVLKRTNMGVGKLQELVLRLITTFFKCWLNGGSTLSIENGQYVDQIPLTPEMEQKFADIYRQTGKPCPLQVHVFVFVVESKQPGSKPKIIQWENPLKE